ncbi:MAG: Gldg family protein [Proteobacteria bacterium]|nr:Gldg family protein [Pseudomonadota bacterium]
MHNGFLLLPFVTLLITALTGLLSKLFTHLPWIPWVGYLLALGVLAAWVVADFENFKAFFKRKGLKYGASSGGMVLIILAALVILAYVTQTDTLNKRVDVTKNKVSSLSQSSIDVVKTFKDSEEKVKITGYFMSAEVRKNFDRLAKLYKEFGAPLDITYVDLMRNPEKAVAAKLTNENTAMFDFGGRQSEITTFSEEEITNILLNIKKEGTKTVYFTRGHGEPSVAASDHAGFSLMKELLGKQKITVKDLSLFESAKIPENADLVVVANPAYDFKEAETTFLDKYLQSGGAVVLSVKAAVSLPVLNDWAKKYGLQFGNDVLLLHPKDIRATFLGRGTTMVSKFDGMSEITKKFSAEGASGGGASLQFRLTRTVNKVPDDESKDYAVEILAESDKNMLRYDGIMTEADLSPLNQDNAIFGQHHGVVGISRLLKSDSSTTDDSDKDDKTKLGKLVLVGSNDVFSNHGMNAPANRDFMGSLVSYMIRDKNFVSIPLREYEKGDINMSSTSSQFAYSFIVLIYPFLFLGATILYWLVRKRKTA